MTKTANPYDKALLAFFLSLIQNEEQQEFLSLMFSNLSEEEIVEKLTHYKKEPEND